MTTDDSHQSLVLSELRNNLTTLRHSSTFQSEEDVNTCIDDCINMVDQLSRATDKELRVVIAEMAEALVLLMSMIGQAKVIQGRKPAEGINAVEELKHYADQVYSALSGSEALIIKALDKAKPYIEGD